MFVAHHFAPRKTSTRLLCSCDNSQSVSIQEPKFPHACLLRSCLHSLRCTVLSAPSAVCPQSEQCRVKAGRRPREVQLGILNRLIFEYRGYHLFREGVARLAGISVLIVGYCKRGVLTLRYLASSAFFAAFKADRKVWLNTNHHIFKRMCEICRDVTRPISLFFSTRSSLFIFFTNDSLFC